MMYAVRQLMLTDDAGYVQTFFWIVPTRRKALKQGHQALDKDTTGRMAINIAPAPGGAEVLRYGKHR